MDHIPPQQDSSNSTLKCEFTAEEIQDWIVNYMAESMKIGPDQIDVRAPFETFALDSAAAMEMTGALEERLDRRIDPTIVFDYPTIEELSEYLAHPN